MDVIIKRWEDYTGQQAVREDDGMKFGELSVSADDAQVLEASAGETA